MPLKISISYRAVEPTIANFDGDCMYMVVPLPGFEFDGGLPPIMEGLILYKVGGSPETLEEMKKWHVVAKVTNEPLRVKPTI